MFVRRPVLAAVVLAVAGISFVGCREDDKPMTAPLGPGGAAGQGGGASEVPVVCDPASFVTYASAPGIGQLPAPPTDAPAGDGAPMQFVVNRMFMGDTDLEGNPSVTAWRRIGRDLDGLSSDPTFDCQCKAVARQARYDIRTDGENGIDNAFGNIIISQGGLPIENASQAATAHIEEGEPTLVFAFADLGLGAQYSAVRARMIPVRLPLGTKPRFGGKDQWHPFVGAPLAAVPLDAGWVSDDTWVSPPIAQTLLVPVNFVGVPMRLPLQNARITAKLSTDRARIVRGIISGVLATEAFVEEARKAAPGFRVCGAAFESVAEQLRQASDSPLSGTHDANVVCDGISIGIGFTAERTGDLGEALPLDDDPAPCP